jgi:UDP-2-acetamido-3-amino-2,3-dideoxy-glucuronate N-acetyltransferase
MQIHPTASVSPTAFIGANTRVWNYSQIGAQARVGEDCIVGSGVYIDREVVIGNKVKIQTGAQLYHGCEIEDGVFVGPSACVTNDRYPRSITPDGRLRTDTDWTLGKTRVRYGASLGAGSILIAGISVGRFALIAAGAVVTTNVPDHGLIAGSPGRLVGYVCRCGVPLRRPEGDSAAWNCPDCIDSYIETTRGLCLVDVESSNLVQARGGG